MVLRKCPQLSQQRCCLTRPSQSSVIVSSLVSADRGGWGGGEGSTCVWFQVWLKSLMRLTTGCFKDNQLQCLLREGDIWGLGFLFVWFVVLKWRDVNSPLKQQSMCFQASVGQLYCLRALSCQLFIWVYSNEERDSARLPSRAESIPYSPSRVSPSSLITLPFTEHAYATKGHLCGICSFFLSSRSPKGH